MVKRSTEKTLAAPASTKQTNTLYNLLAKLSAGDSWHDFHKDITGVGKIIRQNEEKYMEGLPGGNLNDKFEDEDIALSSVVSKIGGKEFSNFGGYLTGDGLGLTYTIETVNGTQYSINSIETSKGRKSLGTKTVIDSYEFVTKLGIEDKSAIVIDATAVSVMDILTSDSTDNTQKTAMNSRKIYYIMAPELINDPAGKTPADHPIFFNNSSKIKGVQLISCVPNSPPSLNYNYTFNNINTLNELTEETMSVYDKFFTAYNFQLSEIQPVRKGIKTEMTTNLLIKAAINGKGFNENVLDSKKKNKIPFLKSILINLIKAFSSNKDKDKNTFLFNTSFQQKRSGDWLQVLLCLALKGRPFKIYRKPGKPQQDGDTGVNKNGIQNDFTHVYFVTHDRIALSFALLCGVECIFTHASTHSAYIFKQASPGLIIAENTNLIANKDAALAKILLNLGNSPNSCDNCKEEISTYYSLIKDKVDTYKRFREDNIIQDFNNQITTDLPNKYSGIFKSDGKINTNLQSFSVDNFTQFTSELFGKCLVYSFLLLNFPSLIKQNEQIEESLKGIKNIAQNAQKIHVNGSLKTEKKIEAQIAAIKQKEEAIALYGKIVGDINSLDSTLSSYFVVKQGSDQGKLSIDINATIKTFQKTPNYKLAAGWNWENTMGNGRIWDAFKSITVGNKSDLSYKSDKNAFLYNLDNLPDDIKSFLSETYIKILTEVINKNENNNSYFTENKSQTISDKRFPKFLSSAKGFCAEVLLNFPQTTGTNNVVSSDAEKQLNRVREVALQGGGGGDEYVEIDVVTDDCINAIKGVIRNNILLSDNAIVSENSTSTLELQVTNIKNTANYSNPSAPIKPESDYYETNKVSELTVEEQKILEDDKTSYSYDENDGVELQSGGAVITRSHVEKNIDYANSVDSKIPHIPNTENCIKSATYVLLNANLDFKPSVKIVERTWGEYFYSFGKAQKTKEVTDEDRIATLKTPISEMEEHIGGSGTPSSPEESEKTGALRELTTDLHLEPAPEEDQIAEDADLFTSTNEYYHPMLPIYMMAESLNEVAQNDAIDESLDYNLFFNYLNYLTQLRETLHASYASKNRLDVICAFVIGEGLKELLFDSDINDVTMEQAGGQLSRGSTTTQVSPSESIEDVKRRIQNKEGIPIDQQQLIFSGKDVGEGPAQSRFLPPSEESHSLPPMINGNLYCEAVMGISEDNFKPVSILTGILKNVISGYKYRTSKEIEDGKIVLKNAIFSDYIKKVNMSDIFSVEREVFEPIQTFREKTLRFLIETGNIIISDRGGEPVNFPSQASPQASAETVHPNAEGLRELQASAAEARIKNAGQEADVDFSSTPSELKVYQQRLNERQDRANKMLEATAKRGLNGGSKKYRKKNNQNTRKMQRRKLQ